LAHQLAMMSRAKISYGKVKKLLGDPVMMVVAKTWRSGWWLEPEVVEQCETKATCKLRYIIRRKGHTPPSGLHLRLATSKAFVTKPHNIFLYENNHARNGKTNKTEVQFVCCAEANGQKS